MNIRQITLAAVTMAAALALVAAARAPGELDGQAPQAQQPTLDKALVARGDSVFKGKLGGAICTTCHGQNAKGMPGMGPDLTDAKWLHGDGSLKFIETIVRTGVTKSKESATVMPPFGGVPLDSAKVSAVTAYVYSLSHK
ncbi:MAG TPA: c-type cytochrome [Gemmatimonadaceae bacterium]|nr:c-type cytochrome [Gemmatimonadaceae bacterium]